jgi:hypothetical protein
LRSFRVDTADNDLEAIGSYSGLDESLVVENKTSLRLNTDAVEGIAVACTSVQWS